MRLVIVAAGNRDLREPRPLVRDEAAGALEPEQAGSQFGRNPDRLPKALAEMPPPIADFIRELIDRHRPVGFRQSSPRPGDFGLRADRDELRDKSTIEDREALAPRPGGEKHLDEIVGALSPDIRKIED